MSGYFTELEGKTVIVTGGSKGIGKDITRTFANLNANVIITGETIKVDGGWTAI